MGCAFWERNRERMTSNRLPLCIEEVAVKNHQGVLATMIAALLLALSPVSADAHGGHGGGGHGGGHAGGGPVMDKPAGETGAVTTEACSAMAEAGYGGHGWGGWGYPSWDRWLWEYDHPYYVPAYPMCDYDVPDPNAARSAPPPPPSYRRMPGPQA
jgi:hypothetical protein